jgi:RNA-binding protein 23/39
MQSKSVLLKNMFDPEEYVSSSGWNAAVDHGQLYRETERDWDKDLAEDVKGECEDKYGKVEAIKVEKETQVRTPLSIWHICLLTNLQGEIYVKFDSIDTAKKAIDGLNGRWFGGKQVSAAFIPDAIMLAHLG